MGKIKVYIYTRISTSMQIDGYSLDTQKLRMKAFCEYNDYEIIGGVIAKDIETKTKEVCYIFTVKVIEDSLAQSALIYPP